MIYEKLVLNEYLKGLYPEDKMIPEITQMWGNYQTDYKPLVEFAKDSSIQFIAANIPRRYASVVYKNGLEALEDLSPEARSYIAPLPIEYDPEVACYKNMLEMSGGHGGENLPKAQAIKDATMAYSIAGYAREGILFLHYNGSYHSDNFEGIVWWINKLKPGLNIKTISTVYQADIEKLNEDNLGRADYIFAIPETMTQTNR